MLFNNSSVTILVLSLLFFATLCSAGIYGTLRGIFRDVSDRVQELTCSYISCCRSHLRPTEWSWKFYKESHLYESLHSKLYGQHLVQDAVVRGISLHMTKPNNRVLLYWTLKKLDNILQEDTAIKRWEMWDDPHDILDDSEATYEELIHEEYEKSKEMLGGALVIWMYGPTGTGKSYTSEIIAESLYKKGLNSPLVHHFGGKVFISLERDKFEYGLKLLDWIDGNITDCPHSMFIFDEFNELPIHLIRMVMKATLSTRNRDAIFVFIMNTDGSDTMEKILALYENGKIREDIKLVDVYKPGFGDLFSFLEKKYGLEECIDEEKFMHGKPKNAIFAPFLPLEREHIQQCIIDHYISQDSVFPSEDMISSVDNNVKYGPGRKEKFSLLGCRRIHSLVTSALSRKHNFEKNEEL